MTLPPFWGIVNFSFYQQAEAQEGGEGPCFLRNCPEFHYSENWYDI